MAGAGRLPTFSILGAMKSGTTSLARYLERHTQIHLPQGLEPHFFDRAFERGPDWYRGLFAGATALQVGDKSPGYLFHPLVAERMAGVIPGARLLAILRDPVDRAYSQYWHERARGRERLPFPEAVAAEPARLARAEAAGDHEARRHAAYVEQGRYLPQLRRFTERFPAERLLVILLDDLQGDPAGTYRRVCRFLGVGDRVVPDNLGRVYNAHRAFRSPRLARVAAGGSGFARRILGRLVVRRRPYPPLDPTVRARVVDALADDIAALESWLGRDLSGWTR